MVSKQVCALVVGVLVLAACGADQPGNSKAYQQGSKNCSSDFISDYNKVKLSLAGMITDSDVATARSLAEQFKAKYNGVKCQAEIKTRGQLNASEATIDANADMDEIINTIDRVMKK